MKIQSVEFDKSISIDSQKVFFHEKNQVIFIGRSNVGKSSLLNSIFGKKDLVKTSSLPGKTKTANLFLVNNKYHFVDLPGYGFAKLGQENKEKLDSLISWYLEEFKPYIRAVFVVLDSKIGPTDVDIDMFKFLQEFSMPIIFLSNKIDRLSNNEIVKSITHSEEIFFGQKIIPVSAKSKVGISEVLKEIGERIKK